MRSSGAVAVVAAVTALAGCGADEKRAAQVPAAEAEPVAAVRVADPPPAAPPRVNRPGVRRGTFRTAAMVEAPPAAPAAPVRFVAAPERDRLPARERALRSRASLLAVLRAHCAARPKDDPRCDGGRVDERVALAGAAR